MQGEGGAIFIIFGVAFIYFIIRYIYAVFANTGELDEVFEQIDKLNKIENENTKIEKNKVYTDEEFDAIFNSIEEESKEKNQKMRKPKVTDDYLFYRKVYKQKNRSFEGVKSPPALWKKVYYATGDYDETKDECIEHYGFYYDKNTHRRICEDEW